MVENEKGYDKLRTILINNKKRIYFLYISFYNFGERSLIYGR